MEKEHIKKMRHEQKLKRMKEDSQRALDKIERHKQGQKATEKILEYVFTRVNVNIDRVEAKRREERKQKIQHQKDMLRECKLWTEEYDESSGSVYYLNYRTHEQRWEIPECWAFREQFEAEQYEKQGGEVPPTGNNEYSEYGQEYAEYDQQGYDYNQ